MTRVRLAALVVLVAGLGVPVPSEATHAMGYTEFELTGVPCSALCPSGEDRCALPPETVPGSWDEQIVAVPEAIEGVVPRLLTIAIAPVVDWDLVVCRLSQGDHYGFGSTQIDPLEPCSIDVIGCVEQIRMPVRPGDVLLIRAFNDTDPFPSPGSYFFQALHS